MNYYVKLVISIFFMIFIYVNFAFSAPLMRISLENSPSHVQVKAVKRFVRSLKHAVGNRIEIQVYEQAQLFRDKDVFQALLRGKVEMAVPGTWLISKYEPNVSIFLLPFFYGRTSDINYKILDSPVGNELNQRIEDVLQVKVVGRWIDLGHANLYGVGHEIRSIEDIKNMRIRVAGGLANELRIAAFGANPTTISWPDLPEKLHQKAVDGVLTTNETIRSAKLWKYGIAYAFEDKEYFPQYIPIIRHSFWKRLPADLQNTIIHIWDIHVDQARKEAAQSQLNARDILQQNGVTIITPSKNEIKNIRDAILPFQLEIMNKLNIDTYLFEKAIEFLK